jgi:hypothetical protein
VIEQARQEEERDEEKKYRHGGKSGAKRVDETV